MLLTPSSFPKGARVRLKELGDCSTCEVTLAEPLPCNRIILDFYELIPTWDGWSGNKNFTVQDAKTLFEIFGVPRSLYDEYYQKLVFFHQQFVIAKGEIDEKEKERSARKDDNKPGQGSYRPRQLRAGSGVKAKRIK